MLTVGINDLFGGGSCGSGPMPAENGSLAVSPHPASPVASAMAKAAYVIGWTARMAAPQAIEAEMVRRSLLQRACP
jgi:hypothetical protein